MANLVLRTLYLDADVDNALRTEAVDTRTSKNDLIRKYLKLGMQVAKEARSRGETIESLMQTQSPATKGVKRSDVSAERNGTDARPKLSEETFQAVCEDFKDSFPCRAGSERSREFADAIVEALNATTQPQLAAEPVYYRYRHSLGEKWHYGPTPQNWWECEGLFVKNADTRQNVLSAEIAQWAAQVTADDWAAFRRVYECFEDNEGYDVPADKMMRLAELGLVRKIRGTWYEFTQLGLAVQDYDPATLKATR